MSYRSKGEHVFWLILSLVTVLLWPGLHLFSSSAAAQGFDEFIVSLQPDHNAKNLDPRALAEGAGGRLKAVMPNRPHLLLIQRHPGILQERFLQALNRFSGFIRVEPNAPVSIPDPAPDAILDGGSMGGGAFAAAIPNDPYLTWGYTDIEADQVAYWRGEGPVVAVIDTGVDYRHPELAGRVIPGYDFHNGDADPMDDHGHGTHVSGIIAAAADNGEGSAGVIDSVRILAYKALGSDGSGSTWNVIQAIYDAADRPEVRVINLSLGTYMGTVIFHDAVDYAVDKGKLLVAAAGNSNSTEANFPAFWSLYSDGVMAVAANDQRDCRASFSNYGEYVTISAPGVSIFSTLPGGGYGSWSGTSMATPFVAAAAARLFAQNPNLTYGEAAEILEAFSDRLQFDGSCWPTLHRNFGNLNLFQALAVCPGDPSDKTPPMVEILSPTSEPSCRSAESPVTIAGRASDDSGIAYVTWQNDRGGSGPAEGGANWSIPAMQLQEGENQITVTAWDTANNQGKAIILIVYEPDPSVLRTIEVQVADRYMDSLEKTYNGMTLPTFGRQYVGAGYINAFHFDRLPIPLGASIVSAKLKMYCWGYGDRSVDLLYQGEAADDASAFSAVSRDLSGRPKTLASIADRPGVWVNGAYNESPDLQSVVQEIVQRPGWREGSGMNLFISDRGSNAYRRVAAFEQDPAQGALLTVTYRMTALPEDDVPPQIHITDPVMLGPLVTHLLQIDVSGTAWDNVGVTRVHWSTDKGVSGLADGTTHWRIDAIPLQEGLNTIVVCADDAAGNETPRLIEVFSEPVPEGEPQTIQVEIGTGSDDAGEKTYNGAVSTIGKTMYIGQGWINGFRFASVPLPPGAVIREAFLQIPCRLYGTNPIRIRYTGEMSAHSDPFTSAPHGLSARPKTMAEVLHEPGAWEQNAYNGSANLCAIVQEIVNAPDWRSGNALALFAEDAGSDRCRMIPCFELDPSLPIILSITFVP
ncbi:S8 family serine peptidase [Desulfatiglans anilini]|uniref:S8 family serine peptidase n=1 Tax=Desulfatiglans anilini TaxID=90728 RepID=UPI0004163DCF|nr:S8 family serine peptidase [Desulfatiglans anilini]